MDKVKKAEKMIKDVENLILNNEYNTVSLKGVRNISRADLDTIQMYGETFIRNNGFGFSPYVEPSDNVEKVLTKYGVTDNVA